MKKTKKQKKKKNKLLGLVLEYQATSDPLAIL